MKENRGPPGNSGQVFLTNEFVTNLWEKIPFRIVEFSISEISFQDCQSLLSDLILLSALFGRHYYYFLFTNKETQAYIAELQC